MRFLHAADIHLDSPMHGLSAYPDAPVELLRNATREAFSELVSRAIDEAVDFMIIAGDLYDGSWRDHNTGIFFCREMGRLKRAGIAVYLLFGNHDAEAEMTKKLDLPDNVHCFGANKPTSFRLDERRVALHGRSFKIKETTENLAASYPPPIAGYYNIGVLHTALEGNAAHASYAPCSLAELHAKAYQYWALGHVHEFAAWHGPSTVVFPGNLQGRNIRETGRRGAVLVTVDEAGTTAIERLYIDVLRWEAVKLDVTDCGSLIEVSRRIGTALEAVLECDPAVPRAVRVTVCGKTRAHGELFGLEAQLRAEVLARIAAIGNERLWLEKVRIETEAFLDAAAAEARLDAFSDLQAIFSEAAEDPAFLHLLKEDLSAFTAKLPLEMFEAVPALQTIRNGEVAGLVRAIAPGLLAHLAEGE